MALGARGRRHRSWDPQSPLPLAGGVNTGQPLSSLKPQPGLQVNPTLRATPPGLRQPGAPAPAQARGQLSPSSRAEATSLREPPGGFKAQNLGKARWVGRGQWEPQQPGASASRRWEPAWCGAVRGRSFRDLGWERVGALGALGAPTRLVQPAAQGRSPSRKRPSGYGLPLRPQGCLKSHLFPSPGLPQDPATHQQPPFRLTRRATGGAHRTQRPSPGPCARSRSLIGRRTASEDGLGWGPLGSAGSGLGRSRTPPIVIPPHPEDPRCLVLKPGGRQPQSQARTCPQPRSTPGPSWWPPAAGQSRLSPSEDQPPTTRMKRSLRALTMSMNSPWVRGAVGGGGVGPTHRTSPRAQSWRAAAGPRHGRAVQASVPGHVTHIGGGAQGSPQNREAHFLNHTN